MISPDNHVTLTGRVSAAPETVILPSGDELATFRLIVDRSAAVRRRSRQPVDTFDCVGWTAAMRRTIARLQPGARVTVTGEMRRRWSRGSAGPMSRVSVEVATCQRAESTAVASAL